MASRAESEKAKGSDLSEAGAGPLKRTLCAGSMSVRSLVAVSVDLEWSPASIAVGTQLSSLLCS